jgi:hypothetical protein
VTFAEKKKMQKTLITITAPRTVNGILHHYAIVARDVLPQASYIISTLITNLFDCNAQCLQVAFLVFFSKES